MNMPQDPEKPPLNRRSRRPRLSPERQNSSFEAWRVVRLVVGVAIGIGGLLAVAEAIVRADLQSNARIPLILFPLISLMEGDGLGVLYSVAGVVGLASGFAIVKSAFSVESEL